MACRFEKIKKRCKFLARAQHMQCATQANFLYGVLMSLSSCANVPSLVSLAPKFTNTEDLTFKKKLHPSGTCRLCRSSLGALTDFVTYGGHRPTKFESCPSTGLPGSLKKQKKRCKFCARAQHVQCAPQTNISCGVLMPLSSCANVPSLVSLAQKFTN